MKFFSYLAAQQRNWSEDKLQRFGLNLRNLTAVGRKDTPITAAAHKHATPCVREEHSLQRFMRVDPASNQEQSEREAR
jgi:hypothetical protein